jgi:hypothetical protein
MAFVTWEGVVPFNQYLLPPVSHLVLSHPSQTDGLILAQFDERPYEHFPTGWQTADGRSVLGSIRLKGGDWRKDLWQCNFFVQAEQLAYFNAFLLAQQASSAPVSVLDRWLDVPITRNVWMNVDRQYLSLVAAKSWWRLQFELWEV